MASQTSGKRIAIDKANARTVAVVGIGAFVTVFCLMASKAVITTNLYQAKVTSAQEKAHKQLQQNLSAYNELVDSYKTFVDDPTNIIKGSKTGASNNDGDNAKIILDALPAQYNFPALTSSIEKILTDLNMQIDSISGTDDQLAQQTNLSSPTPVAVQMPFTFTVKQANYTSVGQLITKLQQSIRPIQIDKISLTGSNASMSLTVSAHTYYQPAKTVNISQKAVK